MSHSRLRLRAAWPDRREPESEASFFLRYSALGAIPAVLGGCSGVQSALAPAGRGSEEIARLFWWMSGSAVVIWAAVAILAIWAIRTAPVAGERRAPLLIIVAGAIVPTILLAVLLVIGLSLMPPMLQEAPAGAMRIAVTGEQWWWRVQYRPPGERPVELANEIRLAVGEPVEFELDSPDVIHSFWIPALGGKMDMIPGRKTRLMLEPTRTGRFRGACAEYCGTSHALMAFDVVVMEKAELKTWLERQRQPAPEPDGPLAVQGRELFVVNGCSACHTVRGTGADGTVGPDLTHVGGRLSLGAGIVRNHRQGFARWIDSTDRIKPGVHMPVFDMLPPEELAALAAYLESLQ